MERQKSNGKIRIFARRQRRGEDLRPPLTIALLARLLFTDRLHVEKTMLGDVKIVPIWVGTAGLGVRPAVRPRLRQFPVVDLLHLFDYGLTVLHLKAEMIKAIGRVLLVIGKNGQVKVAVSEEDGASLFLAPVQQLHIEYVHIKRRQLSRIFRSNCQVTNLWHIYLPLKKRI